MKNIRESISKYPLVSFFGIACLFSWSLWGLMIASSKGLLPFIFPTTWIGSLGPSLAAIVISGFISGKSGIKNLLKLKIRFNLPFYLISIIGLAVPFIFSVIIYALTGNSAFVASRLSKVMEFVWQIPILYPIMMVMGGPLGEEIGWRGLAPPHLLKRNNALMASLKCGIIWAVWHLPLFWLPGSGQYGMPMLLFFVEIMAVSVIFTCIYINSLNSLLAILLAHTGLNVAGYIVQTVYPELNVDFTFNLVFSMVLISIALFIIKADTHMREKRVDFLRAKSY